MERFRFEKPFSSFIKLCGKNGKQISTKEEWRIALHDPAYLIILITALVVNVLLIIELCK